MSEEEQQNVEEQQLSPGQQLQQARKAAGLSVKDIADKLRLKSTHIEQLEADQVDESISLTFTKGYLKNYAKQVDMDEAALLADFDAFHKTSKEPAKLQSFSRRVAKQANDDRLMLVTYLIVVVVIALVVWWWWQQGSSESASVVPEQTVLPAAQAEQPNSQPAAEQQSALQQRNISDADSSAQDIAEEAEVNPVDAALLEETSETLGTANGNPDETGQNDDNAEPAVTDTDSAIETAAVESTPSASSLPSIPSVNDEAAEQTASLAEEALQPAFDTTGIDPIELVFQFDDDCWVNITDATGEAIAYGVKVKGRVMPVTGYPPFEVVLGAPEVVQISYNGDVVDMSQFPSGRTARFELPLAE